MCKLSKIWAHQILLPSEREMHEMRKPMTNQCHQKERSSAVRCVLCSGNHPANYKGCAVYKGVQKKTYPPLRLKQYTPPAQIKQTLHTQPGVTCSSKQTKFLCCNKYRARSTHKPTSSANHQYTGNKRYDEKPYRANGNYAKPPHNHAYKT
jgi:hypothetical protein